MTKPKLRIHFQHSKHNMISMLQLPYTAQQETHKVTNLSFRAMELGYYSAETNPYRLIANLYFYNRIPINKKWKKHIPNEEILLQFLELESDRTWPGNKKIHPINTNKTKSDSYWNFWTIGNDSSSKKLRENEFKLYISPYCEDLPIIFEQLKKHVDKSGAHALKIGRNVESLLRPDKLILYFKKLSDTVRFGNLLLSNTFLNRAQGVPFTHPLDPNGLLSIGFDPPETIHWPYNKEGQSWRLWVIGHVVKTILNIRKDMTSNPMADIRKELLAKRIDPILWRILDPTWNRWMFYE